MSMVTLSIELSGQVTVSGFSDLAHSIKRPANQQDYLSFLVGAWQGREPQTIRAQQAGGSRGADCTPCHHRLSNRRSIPTTQCSPPERLHEPGQFETQNDTGLRDR